MEVMFTNVDGMLQLFITSFSETEICLFIVFFLRMIMCSLMKKCCASSIRICSLTPKPASSTNLLFVLMHAAKSNPVSFW